MLFSFTAATRLEASVVNRFAKSPISESCSFKAEDKLLADVVNVLGFPVPSTNSLIAADIEDLF